MIARLPPRREKVVLEGIPLCADSSQWFDLRSPFYIDCLDISGSNTNSRPTFISVVMASTPFPDTDMQGTYREMLTSEIHHDQPAIGEDPSSVSFIPRSARTVPQALTVHTIYLKKITYPMTSHQPELWVYWNGFMTDSKHGALSKLLGQPSTFSRPQSSTSSC